MIQKETAVLTTAAGESIDAYTLTAGSTRVRILTLGGIVTHLFTPDRDGQSGDIIVGFANDAGYLEKGPYFGALIGRFGNRVARGRFTLDGVQYTLATNNGVNHLHGGAVGYDKRVWRAQPIDDALSPSLCLTLHDPDCSEGYPGNVDVVVTYTLTDGRLRIDYEATADRATPINLTNHAYFNLRDAGATPITDHVLQVDADRYLVPDADLIPVGEPAPVAGTPIDFRHAKSIGKDLMAMGGKPIGYDHCLVLSRASDGSLHRAALVSEPTSGRMMECWTTEPAIQLYSGNFLDGSLAGKGGARIGQRHGFCLETQHYPDSPNHPSYPSTILRPGQRYTSATEFRFAARG